MGKLVGEEREDIRKEKETRGKELFQIVSFSPNGIRGAFEIMVTNLVR